MLKRLCQDAVSSSTQTAIGGVLKLMNNADSDEEIIEKSSAQRNLGKCEVCSTKEARYSCPKCEVKTCSLPCVKIHKEALPCDGIRDRTKFLTRKQITKMDVLNDYYFMEQCTRFTEEVKEDVKKRFTHQNKLLPKHLMRLRAAANERKIRLQILLKHFTRHAENTTFYDWNLKKIFWRVEWIFVNACEMKIIDERCDEDVPLYQLLEKHLNATSGEEGTNNKDLKYYQSVGVFNLKILLKAENVRRSNKRFYTLDAQKSLSENLAGKTLVEYPTIYVSYEADPPGFDIIDSDEDIEAEAKCQETAYNDLRSTLINTKLTEVQNFEEESENVEAPQPNSKHRRKRKHEEINRALSSNFLFADEKLIDMLSSATDDSDDDNEDKNPQKCATHDKKS